MEVNNCVQSDKRYPVLLKNIKKAPESLYYCGEIEIIEKKPCVAIVGSRKASEHGLEVAYEYGKIAARHDVVVVNGLAVGCDTQAARGALSEGGKCVAVMPCGLDKIVPKSNEKLAKEIVNNGGCLISEYSMGVRPQRYSFVQRDRIQSGISKGVIVIESDVQGGTMHTVKFAEEQGRRLAVYYSKIMDMKSGNKEIVENKTGKPLADIRGLEDFLKEVKNMKMECYEQMSFVT